MIKNDIYALLSSAIGDRNRYSEKIFYKKMNVNLDTIHHGHQHEYMLEFFKNKEQQEIIRQSGVRLSIGFDGHRVYDYNPERIADYCRRITEMGIKLAFEE